MNQSRIPAHFDACAQAIVDAAREFAARGWTPATSSNFSMRLSPDLLAITSSGHDKGKLVPANIMVVDLDGRAVESTARPSAETLLHCQIYQRYADVGAVLHTHSLVQTLASRIWASEGRITLAGYELLKAFAGYESHDASMDVPVFANSQDMAQLCEHTEGYLRSGPNTHGYLIDGHGIYAWGKTMADATRHLDAFEFLLSCELEMRKMQR